MEGNNKIDELRAQSGMLKDEQEKMKAKAEQLEMELIEKEIAELKKQLEVLETKDVSEQKPSKVEAVKPVAPEKSQTVEAEPEIKETFGGEKKATVGALLQTDAVPEKSDKKGGKKKLWLILLLAFILTAVACCVVFPKLFNSDDKAGNKVPAEETVVDEAALDSLTIVGILEEVNRKHNDIYYTYELPMSSEYSQLLTRANNITDSITRTTGVEWDDDWYALAIPWMAPWADPDTVEYEILEYVNLEDSFSERVEVTVEYNDPEYRGYLSTVTAVFVSEAGNWVIDNVGSHKEILADFIERSNRAQIKVCEYVDLGLPSGVQWATCNVGASSPEAYGGYYAWGETEAKPSYDWDNYKWCRGTSETLTKYCTSISLGTVDNISELEDSDDVATVVWGSDWRMPTDEERNELNDFCVWEWTTLNGVRGYRATSKTNGNSIFFPAAGYRMGVLTDNVGVSCYYWTKSLYSRECYFSSYLYKYTGERDWMSIPRQAGMPVRPVWKHKKDVDTIKIVEDDVEVEEQELVSVQDTSEWGDVEETDAFFVEEEVEEEVLPVAEEQPEFPGGNAELMKFFKDNIKYPKISRDNGSQGKTFVKFIVNSDGSIQDANVIRSSGDVYLDKEAIRVIEAMPKWKPGRQLGKAVRVEFVLPVNFRLQ